VLTNKHLLARLWDVVKESRHIWEEGHFEFDRYIVMVLTGKQCKLGMKERNLRERIQDSHELRDHQWNLLKGQKAITEDEWERGIFWLETREPVQDANQDSERSKERRDRPRWQGSSPPSGGSTRKKDRLS
jgi:hypothetical protein